MPFSTESALPPPNIRILDLMDPPEYQTIGSATPIWVRRGGFMIVPNQQSPVLNFGLGFPSWTPGNPSQFEGAFWMAAQSAVNTRNTMYATSLSWPCSLDLSNCPPAGLQPMRFELQGLFTRTAPLVADAPLNVGFMWNGGGVSTLGQTLSAGYELISHSTLNAGRWTAQSRRVRAGAITMSVDTGIPGDTPIFYQLRLDRTTNPKLSVLVNGVEFGVLQGQANMPTSINGTAMAVGVCQGLNPGGGAGQIDFYRQGRYIVEELPGFPT